MAAKKVDIMEIRQLILLKKKGESNRSCARHLGIHRNTINHYVRLFRASGYDYAHLSNLDDKSLSDLFPSRNPFNTYRYRVLSSNFLDFEKQKKALGCTREKIWQDYYKKHPGGYSYTQFNEHYSRWLKSKKISGKLTHKAGDKIYVDYTGKKLHITDKETGEQKGVEVFVAILPASHYTYVEASWSQKKEDFISSINNCLYYFGGVPKTIVTDNLKSAVSKASKYEAIQNKTLKSLALHYQTTINPTRAYAPQDKALVEGAVKLVYQRIFYPLSKMTFFSLESLNSAIAGLLTEYNKCIMKVLCTSREKQFLDIERPYLSSLPSHPYQIKEFRKAKVQKIGYIFLNAGKNYYSVPSRYIGQQVEVQYDRDNVEIYYKYERVAFHKRSYQKGFYTTVKDHLSSAHKFYKAWSPDYFLGLAANLGPHIEAYVKKLLDQASYPEIAYKQCLGIIKLKKEHSVERLDKACQMALNQHRYSYHIIRNILVNKIDLIETSAAFKLHISKHDNIRGSYS